MGYDIYTYFGIFKTNEQEKQKLIDWLTEVNIEGESGADSNLREDLLYGIKDECKWLITMSNDNKFGIQVNNPIQSLSAKFPALTFFFVCIGEGKEMNYMIGHRGQIMIFDFEPNADDVRLVSEIEEKYSEDAAIAARNDDWDEDLYYAKMHDAEHSMLKRKMNELSVDDLSDVFDS
jgi:hypothetical protein